MIPIRWPDVTMLAINYLRTALPGVTVTRTKRDDEVKQVVVDTEPQQLETPLSRRVTVLMEAWAELPNGGADTAAAVDLMNDAMFALQLAPNHIASVVRFDQPVGPSIEKDEAKFEYTEGSVVLVISA